jgi:HEAT repeat protein
VRSLNPTSIIRALAAIAVLPSTLAAQTLAQRISRAGTGLVQVHYASRAGTCGNGKDMIGYRKALFAQNFQSIGNWHSVDCAPGPVRVVISVSDGKVTGARTFVDNNRDQMNAQVTDLGTVGAPEAAAYFFSLVPVLERARDKSRVLLPAVLADAGDVTPQLTSLARDGSRNNETRRQAIHWLGLVGDAKVIPTLVAFARAGGARSTGEDIDEDDEAPGMKGLATTAMAALAAMDNGIGVPPLIELARSGSSTIRKSAVFWLGQSGDARAFAMLHTVIENTGEDEGIRSQAIFALSHGGDVPASEFAYLRNIYPRLASNKLRDAVLMGMGQDESNGSSWLIQRARDTAEPMEMRKQALFWAGQRKLTTTTDLVAVYRSASESTLKDHAIFVLSQRDDDAAVTELMRIAREDGDKRMRARAMFWLGQKNDPRVTRMIQERIER